MNSPFGVISAFFLSALLNPSRRIAPLSGDEKGWTTNPNDSMPHTAVINAASTHDRKLRLFGSSYQPASTNSRPSMDVIQETLAYGPSAILKDRGFRGFMLRKEPGAPAE